MAACTKVVIVAGYGTGISAAVATRFGGEGYNLALISRTAARLHMAVACRRQQGAHRATLLLCRQTLLTCINKDNV